MLPRHKNKIDLDGYSMLVVSTIVMIATAGISYLFCLKKIFNTAKNTQHLCDKNTMVCVLGKKLINEKPDYEYIARLQRASSILNDNNDSQVLLLGGKTGKASVSEAFAGKEFLLKNNIDVSRIHLEEASRNTLENIKNAIDLLIEKDKKVVVVTNRYHLARAKQMSNGFGFDVDICAAEDKFKINLNTLFKLMIEALHVHWYISGHYYARITKNKRIIKRVGKLM